MNNLTAMPKLPRGTDLLDLLDVETPVDFEALLVRPLTEPVEDLFTRPRKNLRDHLVRLGFMLAGTNSHATKDRSEELIRLACEILELFHAGSLIIDDIEDESKMRRGRECLHLLYGTPLALNAGNLLYFLPFRLIDKFPVSEAAKASISRHCQETLLQAHYGQAIDLGTRIESVPQEELPNVAKASMELKSGALTALALKFGALALEADRETVDKLNRFGRKLGLALQMFDDIGNLTSAQNPNKRGEDIRLRRLSLIAAVAAEKLNSYDYKMFLDLLCGEDSTGEQAAGFLSACEIPTLARETAKEFLTSTVKQMRETFDMPENQYLFLQSHVDKLVSSYE